MDYINEYGEVIKIPVSDEVWLDDAFFEREMSKLPPDAPRAGLAYRVSTKGQVDHDDIPMQKIECRKFCVQHGWRVVAEKSEKGVSGSKVSAQKRDAIQYFKSIAENGEIDILLLYIFDRLGRIESETPFVLEWFVKHGVQVWSTREGEQRIENHTDKLLNYIRFWQAAGESEKIAERVSTRIRQLNSSGYYSGGTVPYGYRAVYKGRTNKKGLPVKDLEIEPAEATIVQELFGKTAYFHCFKSKKNLIGYFASKVKHKQSQLQRCRNLRRIGYQKTPSVQNSIRVKGRSMTHTHIVNPNMG